MTKSSLMIDVNTADAQGLMQLPGVGASLAERIIAARPFASVDELQRVSGLGPRFLERMRSQVLVSPPEEHEEEAPTPTAAEAEAPSPTVDETPTRLELPPLEEAAPPPAEEAPPQEEAYPLEEATPPPEREPEPEETPPPVVELAPAEVPAPEIERPRRKKEPALVTRAQAFWMILSAAVIAFFLAVVLSLGILTAINGGLEFATPADVAEVASQADALSLQIDALESDLKGVRTRLDNLERLSGRLDQVEEASAGAQASVEAMGTQVEALQDEVAEFGRQVEDFDEEMETLRDQYARFQAFLDGLLELLNEPTETEETR
jgi:prefoldin subunit 5